MSWPTTSCIANGTTCQIRNGASSRPISGLVEHWLGVAMTLRISKTFLMTLRTTLVAVRVPILQDGKGGRRFALGTGWDRQSSCGG